MRSRGGKTSAAWFKPGGRLGVPLAYLLTTLAIAIGWLGRDARNLQAGEGLGYLLGIIGGVAIIVLPLYSARKRLRLFRWLGPIRHWFKAHMGLGIIGPLIILFHCNFKLGDLNSRVALYCALLVAGSGIVGRYLYAKIHLGLYGRRATLADRTQRVQESLGRTNSGLFRSLYEQMAALDREVLHDAESLTAAALRPVAFAWRTRVAARKLDGTISSELDAAVKSSPAVAEQRMRLERTAKRHVREHLRQVRAVALFGFYERAFHLWHVIHLPFFFLLVLSAIVHVIAVHMY
jgi:hypothetical protein